MVKTGGNTMKNILSFFAIAAMLLVSCTNGLDDNNSVAGANPSEEGVFAPGKYTFNVTVAETKAVKTVWENDDKIFVFFDDEATKAATGVSNLPYITLTFDGEDWVADDQKAPAEIPASGILSAVYCPYGGGEITVENGIFYVSRSHGFYMEATEVPYTNIANEVTFALSMTMTQPYAHFIIPAEGLDKAKSYTLSVRNTDKTAGIQKTFTACINPAEGSVYCKEQNVGDAVDGYWEEDGLHFYGLASLGEDKGLAFDLRDNSSPQILYSYAKTGIEKFEGGSNVKLAAISNWTTLTDAEHKKCHLYEDGTLIINENRYNQADNALKHGAIVKTYATKANNEFNMWTGSASNQPWNSEKTSIVRVEFGTTVAPTGNFRGVFQGCSNLKEIDTKNLDISAVTTLKRAFADCTLLEVIDVSGFDTSQVTDMEGLFDNCKALKSLDVSGWNVSKVQSMLQMFSDCGALTELDLSNWQATSVTNLKEFASIKVPVIDMSGFDTSNCTNMYKMLYYCNKTTTIYVSSDKFVINDDVDTRQMFGNCHSLIGGAGTVFDSNCVDGTYARIDGGADAPGYFTLKQ